MDGFYLRDSKGATFGGCFFVPRDLIPRRFLRERVEEGLAMVVPSTSAAVSRGVHRHLACNENVTSINLKEIWR